MSTALYGSKLQKSVFWGVKLPKRPLKPVHCAPDMFKKFGQIPMGPYPFGIFKIRPKIRLRRRFENSKENQHEFWTQLTTHCAKVNEKKLSKCQFHFPRLLVACPMLKKWKKKIVPMDSWDNPIYPISDPDGQDQGLIFLGGKCWLFIVIQLCYSVLWPISQ